MSVVRRAKNGGKYDVKKVFVSPIAIFMLKNE
jgi:hypothetical protein